MITPISLPLSLSLSLSLSLCPLSLGGHALSPGCWTSNSTALSAHAQTTFLINNNNDNRILPSPLSHPPAAHSTPTSPHSLLFLPKPPQSQSQTIHKLRILPVRQVEPLLILDLPVAGLSADPLLLHVRAAAVEIDEQQIQNTRAPADDDGDLGGAVLGRVGRAEGLGPDDVADAVADEVHGRNGGFLRVARDVAGDQAEESDEGRGARLRHVVACQPGAGAGDGHGDDEDDADECDGQAD